MKTANLISETLRHSESGLTWEEKISGGQSSIEVPKHASVRVRATGASTVTIDGVLAVTMATGEILILNAGDGDPDGTKSTVTVAIGVANAFVQVAREVKRPKLAV